jgi:hypothetical protein
MGLVLADLPSSGYKEGKCALEAFNFIEAKHKLQFKRIT